MPLQPGQNVIKALTTDRDPAHRQAHGRLQLQEAPQPTGRPIDFFLAIIGLMLGLSLESGGVDEKARFPIAAEFLKMLIESPRIIDVGRSQGYVLLGGKRAAIHAQAAVAALIRTKTFKEQNVLR